MSTTETHSATSSTDTQQSDDVPFTDEQLDYLEQHYVPKDDHEAKLTEVKIECDHANAILERENAELKNELKPTQGMAKAALEKSKRLVSLVIPDGDIFDWTNENDTTIETYVRNHGSVIGRLDGDEFARTEDVDAAEDVLRNKVDRLTRTVSHAKDELGLNDADIYENDKITDLLRHGPSAITDDKRKHTILRRARHVLENAGEWGNQVSADANGGKRINLYSPDIRTHLKAAENLSQFQSRQSTAVLRKIQSLAADSPREANLTKNNDGINRLSIVL